MSGVLIVLTAPLTEMIDYKGYFIQMAAASIPLWMEGALESRYPGWKQVKRFPDGSAARAPAGLRVLERVLVREFGRDRVVACYPDDLDRFIGPATRVVAISTHNPLGVTFAAGVYTSLLGSSKMPINAHYADRLFTRLREHPCRPNLRVIAGGSGAWQITGTASRDALGIDCVVDGRSESPETIELFQRAVRGEPLPREATVRHPDDPASIVFPDRPTTFGVVEMTTGCGRRCRFCVPDLNPQIALPKARILEAVRANVEQGNTHISLATEDMFIWGQVRTSVPFFFPNREALLDLYAAVVNQPGIEHHVLTHATIAPAVVDPELIRGLSEILLPKSPLTLPAASRHPQKKMLSPLIGLETASVPLAKRMMPTKAVPFPIEDWPSVLVRGLEILNRHHWFPVMTLMIGNPGEADEDVKATLDLVYEFERRGLFAFLVPSVFTPLDGTRMAGDRGVTATRDLTRLQWQLMMKCWKFNMARGLRTWWGQYGLRIGALVLWAKRLRRTNGPNFFWPLLMFAGVLPERLMIRLGVLYGGRPLAVKTRAELLAAMKPHYRQFVRPDTGDLPPDAGPPDGSHDGARPRELFVEAR
jgi:radical SAM superfamily enzyme YgiQ (UPF0313 family)